MTGWDLPRTVEIGNRSYKLNTDFRDVLDILSRLNDAKKSERMRLYTALALFYEDFDQMPSSDYAEAVAYLMRFLNCGEAEEDGQPQPKRIDWEQDRMMIVAEVNRVAGTEIRALPFVHWWTFLAWFNAIGDGPLSTVVSIREKRRKGKKLDDWEREYYQENRSRIDFRKQYSAEELEEQERIKRLLGE